MSGTGTYGGYGPQQISNDYPPGPAAWAAGAYWPLRPNNQVYANDLNQQLSAPVSFLMQRPHVLLQQQAPASQATAVSGTATPVPIIMDAEISDAWGMHANSTDLSQVVIPVGCDGYYLMSGQLPLWSTQAVGTDLGAQLYVNGTSVAVGGSIEIATTPNYATPQVADLEYLTAGSYVQLAGTESSGSGAATFLPSTTPLTATGDMLPGGAQLAVRYMTGGSGAALGTGGVYPGGTYQGTTTNGLVNMTYPSLQLGPVTETTWTDNQGATNALFNSNIRQAVLTLANLPAFRLCVLATGTAVSPSTWTPVTNMTATFDTWNGLGSSVSTWTCPLAGLYVLGGAVSWPSTGSRYNTSTSIMVTSGGVTTRWLGQQSGSPIPVSTVTRHIRLNAGDTVQLGAYQAFTSSVTTAIHSHSVYMFGAWVSQ